MNFLSTFRAIIFAKNANEQSFCFCFFSGLASAARLNVNHFAADVAINGVFNHQSLLYPEEAVVVKSPIKISPVRKLSKILEKMK